MNKTSESEEKSVNITHDAKVCPKCFGKMTYNYFHYNHIGAFKCDNCGYTNESPKYVCDNVDFESGMFEINSVKTQTQYKSVFNFLNVTAAVSLCCEAGIPIEDATKAASSFIVSKQRFDEFSLGDRKAVMILSKNQNPVSFDQSISYLLAQEGKKTVIVYVNNINHTHQKDTTWLYDISFERLSDKISSIVCTGPRAYDLAVRLKFSDFDMKCVQVEPELSKLKKVVDKTEGTVYILTELYDAQAILNVISKGEEK